MEPAPNLHQWRGSKNSKGAHLSLLCQHQNIKRNDSIVQVKQNIHKHKDNHAT